MIGRTATLSKDINHSVDSAWALDCTTWAGMPAFSIVNDDAAFACLETAKEVYLTFENPLCRVRKRTATTPPTAMPGYSPASDHIVTERRVTAGASDLV